MEKSIVVTCANADDGRHHQLTAVPTSVLAEYERLSRPYTCYLCRQNRIAAKAGLPVREESAEDRDTIFDKWGRVKDVVHMVRVSDGSEEL